MGTTLKNEIANVYNMIKFRIGTLPKIGVSYLTSSISKLRRRGDFRARSGRYKELRADRQWQLESYS